MGQKERHEAKSSQPKRILQDPDGAHVRAHGHVPPRPGPGRVSMPGDNILNLGNWPGGVWKVCWDRELFSIIMDASLRPSLRQLGYVCQCLNRAKVGERETNTSNKVWKTPSGFGRSSHSGSAGACLSMVLAFSSLLYSIADCCCPAVMP
jgi:hypothetical protein